jgi:hypothetical protein
VPDPAGLAAAHPANPRSWNRHAYVMNNPVNATDPMGLYEGQEPEAPFGGDGICVTFNCGHPYDPEGWVLPYPQLPRPRIRFPGVPVLSHILPGEDSLNWPLGPSPTEILRQILSANYSVFGVPTLEELMGRAWIMDAQAANNGTPQTPQQPKSPARQQCEANAANKYQNTFNAVDNSFYRNAYKSGLKGAIWTGLAGCAVTIEIGCGEGGLPGFVIGGLAGAGKSMWEDLGSVGMAYLQYRDEMKACAAIP